MPVKPATAKRLWVPLRQVQLARQGELGRFRRGGRHWRPEEAVGIVRSAGWWQSVTVTWTPAPTPDRRPAVLDEALRDAAAGLRA